MAATRPHHHISILFQYNVGIIVEVEHAFGAEFSGRAARHGNIFLTVADAHQSLNNSVVTRVHLSVHGKLTFAVAVVRGITFWCNDPIL